MKKREIKNKAKRMAKIEEKIKDKAEILSSCKLTDFERKQLEKSLERLNNNLNELGDLLRDIILEEINKWEKNNQQ